MERNQRTYKKREQNTACETSIKAGIGAHSSANDMARDVKSMEHEAETAFAKSKFGILLAEIEAQRSPKYLDTSFFKLLWIFVTASMIGLILEDGFHLILYGGWESRAGLVWGPFSPVYGIGALLLTIFLNRLCNSHNVVIFVVAMLVGSGIEYFTSWGMEYFWGAVAWNYSGTIGSIGGRTNLFFGVIWGTLGLLWVRIFMPLYKFIFGLIDEKAKPARILTACVSVFLAVDITVTVLALNRYAERQDGVASYAPINQAMDACFPDEWMQDRFHNMTVYG